MSAEKNPTQKPPELLAPAGTPAKLKTALHFGADAVYLGLKRFSMRAKAGNFDLDQLEWALTYAHERGRRIIVAVNILPMDGDLEEMERTLKLLGADLRPDGIVLGDAGALALARRAAPEVPLHLSTQLSVCNRESARFWFSAGIRRIVLARELSLEQLEELVPVAGGEIEVFVHGAVCIAFSGRCLLSLYWADRDPRHGACAQGCRWRYRALEDGRRPGEENPVEEDERGTYFFDAKDLCALPLLPRLVTTGVHALKIEGRTRSPHYLGVTVDVYRQALDRLATGDQKGFEALVGSHTEDLARASRRGFSTHFLGGEQDLPASYNPEGSYAGVRFEYIGPVVRANREGVEVEVRNAFEAGQALEVRDRGLVCEAATADRPGRTGDVVLLRGRFAAGPGALVRRAREA